MFSVPGARPLVQFHFLNEEANPVWEGMGGGVYRSQSKFHTPFIINYT